MQRRILVLLAFSAALARCSCDDGLGGDDDGKGDTGTNTSGDGAIGEDVPGQDTSTVVCLPGLEAIDLG